MKFIVEREHLLKPLQQVSSPLGGRPTLPILGNLLLQVTEGSLLLTGTDLEMEMVARVALSQPHEPGATTVPARKFFDICRGLPEGAEIAVTLESERMLHARVDQVGVDTQREVVKEERRQRYENQPYGGILIEVLKRAYTEHPYQWPTIGFMEDLNAASEADYKTFYKTFYVPNNAVLVVAGDIDPQGTRALVEKYFAAIPKGDKIPRNTVVEPPLGTELRDVVHDRIQLPAVVLAYRIPGYGTKDFYAVDMLNRLPSNGNSSRLNKRVKDQEQKALYVGAFSFPLEDPGLAIAFAIANGGVSPDSLEHAMDEVFAEVREKGVPAAELEKLKAGLETEFVNANARVAGIAENLASAYTFLGSTAKVNTELDQYMHVTTDDLQRAAQHYFDPKKRVVLHYLPMVGDK